MHYLEAGDAGERRRVRGRGGGQGRGGAGLRPRGRPLPLRAEAADQLDRASGRSCEVQLGDALANAGRGAEAAEAYLSAAKGSDPALAIELHRRAAQQLFIERPHRGGRRARCGPSWRSSGMTAAADAPHGAPVPLLRRAQVRLRGLRFRERDEAADPGPGPAADRHLLGRRASAWPSSTWSAAPTSRPATCVLALRAGEPYRMARGPGHGGRLRRDGRQPEPQARARASLQASQALAERVNHPYAVGLATLTAGIAAWLDGRWRDARDPLRRARSRSCASAAPASTGRS